MGSESKLSRRASAALGAAALALLLVACGGGETDVASTESTAPASSTETSQPAQQDDETSTTDAPEATAPDDAGDSSATTDSTATTDTADSVAADSGRLAIQILSADEAIANAEANIGSLEQAENPFDVEVLAVGDGSVQTVRDVVTGDRPVLLWFFSPH